MESKKTACISSEYQLIAPDERGAQRLAFSRWSKLDDQTPPEPRVDEHTMSKGWFGPKASAPVAPCWAATVARQAHENRNAVATSCAFRSAMPNTAPCLTFAVPGCGHRGGDQASAQHPRPLNHPRRARGLHALAHELASFTRHTTKAHPRRPHRPCAWPHHAPRL